MYPFEEEGGRLVREAEAPRVDLMDSSRTILNRLLRKRSGPHLSSRRVAACLQGRNEIPIASNLEKRIFRSFSYRGKIRAIIIY